MLPSPSLIGAIVEAIEEAADAVVEELASGRIEQEPDFTSQMVGEIRGGLRRQGLAGLRWEVKVLTDRGPKAQERRFGADLVVVQHLEVPGYEISKGFLAQAKLDGKKERRKELREQAQKMLEVTPESFLFLYGRSGVQVGSASAVAASQGNVPELRLKPLRGFVIDFLTSWVGDRRIEAVDEKALTGVQREYGAPAAVGIFARPLEL